MKFEHIVKLGTLRSALKIKESMDPAAASLIGGDTDKKLKKIANSLSINWPATSEDIEKTSKRLKGEHVKQWAELRSQEWLASQKKAWQHVAKRAQLAGTF